MGRPRKTKAEPEPAPAFSIGNCKVEIHGSGLRCEPTEQGLTVSGPRGAKVVVSVSGDQKSASNGVGEGSQFILLNPSDADSQTKSLLQEALTLYKQELPSMDYAADTGRKSGFLEKCTTNGKYKTLILTSSPATKHEEVIAAVSYQIVPADTQYAEIPLAVVRSSHQRAGIGHLLYKELSQRLQNVGVTTIFCWADKSFISVGEVDTRGKIRKIPVRADIKKALCFPGGSTLMVAHLKKELPILQTCDNSQTSPLHNVALDSISPDGTDVPLCENMVLQTYKRCNVRKSAKVARNDARIDCSESSLPEQEPKKRIYEISSSSLKSKRIRCSNDGDNCQDMNQNDARDNYFCSSPGNSVLIPKEHHAPSTGVHLENKMSGDEKAVIHSNGSPTIMLMNIADEQKKARLTKVVETLGGFVTCEGHSCTHIVTGKARRTMNFCIALSSGAWIVSPNWLKESFRQGQFVGEAQYVLEDEEYRMQYKSEVRDAVMRAKERPNSLFSGYTFCLSKHIQPSFGVLSSIIKSTGGKIIKRLSELDEPSHAIFLVCEEETELALVAAKRGIKTFSSDWFMSCVMKQELDLEAPQFTVSL
ncbi:mediator of DNA damage checkpoint protein 1 isoform X1 [Panicum miliaceum]|uniref:Mediator of DNA damage checkpoint protein 1 isoform X1 n=1 Tax=Panicum miliaceum TaxID=4540 RepID=A0A3L6SVS2_PANMI|nr:mediator of DNA damage checkpoint protein 1 isoform X1 [Panicum miliaceum]